jgi:hypothetical protein
VFEQPRSFPCRRWVSDVRYGVHIAGLRNSPNINIDRFHSSLELGPKLTDLDCPFRLASMPLYVSQIRARLNFGSASIRLHLHGSGSFLMSSVPPPVLYLLPAHAPLLPLPNRYGPRKYPLEVVGNFTRATSRGQHPRMRGCA